MHHSITYPEHLPKLPGVYLFKDASGRVLYVGKAKSLAVRVRSYFMNRAHHKVAPLLSAAHKIDYIVTRSESDALLLEEYLVKRYAPLFNVLLTSGKPFSYLVFTNEKIPALHIVRSKDIPGRYFGPFAHRRSVRRCYEYMMKTFQLYRCTRSLPQGCLKYHLGICAGSCTESFDIEAYRTRMQLAQEALAGNADLFLQTVQNALDTARASLQFEQAKRLHELQTHMRIIFETIRHNFSPQRYQADIVAQELSQGTAPHSYDIYPHAEHALQELLSLSSPIRTIDCFDISHTQGRSIVGSSIRFTNGIPHAKEFRRFLIRSLTTQNDYAALQEVARRRYRTSMDTPDLLLIDGGKGQLNAVRAIVPNLSVVSLAKREERLFTSNHPDGIVLDISTPIGKLLTALRDYAHHFALSYHQLRNSQELRTPR